MKKLTLKIPFEKQFRILRGYFPSKLPQTKDEFDLFIEKITSTYDLPRGDSFTQAIATMIMHVELTKDSKPFVFFARGLRKSIANQVSYEVIDALRQKAKTQQEVTQQLGDESPGEQPIQDSKV